MIHIEDYISGFLLKNKYCAISGLGTLELNREPSSMRSDDSGLAPPNYNISFAPIGVIDDAFATYIANHENVSISKASNDIKTFSQDVKATLHKTGRYDVNGVGYFTFKNESMQFYQDETLDLERDPIQLYSAEQDDEQGETLADAQSFKDLNYTHAEKGMSKPKMATLLKYLLGMLLLIGLAAAGYFGYRYYESNKKAQVHNEEEALGVENFEDVDGADTVSADGKEENERVTEADSVGANVAVAAPVAEAGEYKIAVKAFDTQAEAQAQSDKFNSWHKKTAVLQQGNLHYLVVYASTLSGDTVKLKDSLRAYYNPKGIPFMVK